MFVLVPRGRGCLISFRAVADVRSRSAPSRMFCPTRLSRHASDCMAQIAWFKLHGSHADGICGRGFSFLSQFVSRFMSLIRPSAKQFWAVLEPILCFAPSPTPTHNARVAPMRCSDSIRVCNRQAIHGGFWREISGRSSFATTEDTGGATRARANDRRPLVVQPPLPHALARRYITPLEPTPRVNDRDRDRTSTNPFHSHGISFILWGSPLVGRARPRWMFAS